MTTRQIQMMPRRFDVSWRKPDANQVLNLSGQDQAIGSTLKDRSGNGNDGTITGATWAKLPSGLWYLDFNGSSNYVNIGTDSSLDITAQITLEVWCNPTNFDNFMSPLAKSINKAYEISILQTTGQIGSILHIGGSTRQSTTTGSLTAGAFNHVVITYNADRVRIYIKGALDTTSVSYSGGAIGTWATPCIVGCRTDNASPPTGNQLWFLGGIGLPRLYNTALSDDVIAQHYAQERHLFAA